MAAKVRPGRATPRTRESSPVSMLAELVKQGTESFFATQRIVFDLVMRQNANTMNAIGERLAALRATPATLTEVAGEGISNFIAAQRHIYADYVPHLSQIPVLRTEQTKNFVRIGERKRGFGHSG